jgi:phosphatidylglycerol:prolipoprotein diacylglycerol transferase
LYARKKKLNFFTIADATSPGLLWAYGIARIGCHLSGDGDYGYPTTLPWGTNYSNGTYPPSLAFRHFPEITSKFPNGIVPDSTPCQPTPVYEFIICTILFYILWKNRARIAGTGRMFMWYLIAAGSERFTIEFLRINPKILIGLSEAQLISVVLILFGLAGLRFIPSEEKDASP